MGGSWRKNELERSERWVRLSSLSSYDAHKLAKISGVTVRQLERYFNHDFNRSSQDWLNEQRMIAARYIMLEAESVKSVAIQLGFKRASHFSREFKRCYGVCPSKYKSITDSFS